MFDNTVAVYRTPAFNSSGGPDQLVTGLGAVVVDIQEADVDPHLRDPGFGISSGQMEEWYNVFLRDWQPTMPDIRERDRLVDNTVIDPLTGQLTAYRVRRVRKLDGLLHCEKISTPYTS